MFHAHDALAALLDTKDPDKAEDKSFRFEIEAGLRYIREDFNTTLTSLANLLPNKRITFSVLWAIFPPNTIIYGRDDLLNPRAWRVRSTSEVEEPWGRKLLRIEPEYIDFDGQNVSTANFERLEINAFIGARDISELPYLPVDYAPNPTTVRTNLLEMGRRAMSLHGRQLVEYKGHGLKHAHLVEYRGHGLKPPHPPPVRGSIRGRTKFNVRETREILNNCTTVSYKVSSRLMLHVF